jgi:hypothetical protein
MEGAFLALLGGGAFGLAAVATFMGVIWVGRATITHFFTEAADEFRSMLKSKEARYDQILKASIDFKGRQLTEFYWPIYVRLQKDNAVWNRILDRDKTDDVLRKVAVEIENKEILPNHDQIVETIQTKIHLAQPDAAFQAALMRYVRHVAVYKAMRSAGVNDRDPVSLNEPWPRDLFDLVKSRTERLQEEYDALVASSGLTSPGTN